MDRLRLMTYNVRYFGHSTRGVVATRRTLRRIAGALASLVPLCDVICLQEVEGRSLRSGLVTAKKRNQLQALLQELDRVMVRRGLRQRYQAHYFPAHSYRLGARLNLYTTGLAILVADGLEIEAHNAGRSEDITHRRGYKALKQTRICAHVRVKKGALRLDVFNTHMSLPGPFYLDFWRHEQRLGFCPNQLAEAQRILEVVQHHRAGGQVVRMGDFISLPGSPVDQLLRREGGLVDALGHCKGLSEQQLRGWPTAGFRNMRMAIDRVYSTPAVEWVNFDGSAPYDLHRFGGLSDHVPLVGTMQLSP